MAGDISGGRHTEDAAHGFEREVWPCHQLPSRWRHVREVTPRRDDTEGRAARPRSLVEGGRLGERLSSRLGASHDVSLRVDPRMLGGRHSLAPHSRPTTCEPTAQVSSLFLASLRKRSTELNFLSLALRLA